MRVAQRDGDLLDVRSTSWREPSLAGVVDRVLGDLDDEIFVAAETWQDSRDCAVKPQALSSRSSSFSSEGSSESKPSRTIT
jgi:hypothetical protein